MSEREITTLGHMFVQDEDGFRHASDGPIVCLADGINSHQWRWLDENWRTAYEHLPAQVLGATVVWSEAALEAEIADYPTHRVLTRQKIAAELQKRGAPLHVVANAPNIAQTRGCLLVPRPELLPAAELAQVLNYEHGPVVMIGRQAAELPPADLSFADGPGPDQLICRVYHAGIALEQPIIPERRQTALPDLMPDPPNYLYDLYFRPVGDEFLDACTRVLTSLADMPVITGDEADLRMLAFGTDDGGVRVLVGNEAHIYVLGTIDMRFEVASVRIASHFPGREIEPDGTHLDVRVPPRGIVVLDVTPAEL